MSGLILLFSFAVYWSLNKKEIQKLLKVRERLTSPKINIRKIVKGLRILWKGNFLKQRSLKFSTHLFLQIGHKSGLDRNCSAENALYKNVCLW